MANRRNYTSSRAGSNMQWNNVSGKWTTFTVTDITRTRVGSDYDRRKPKSGWIPPTSYSMTEEFKDGPSGTWDTTHRTTGAPIRKILGDFGGTSHPVFDYKNDFGSTVFPAELQNRALTKARIKLKGSDINLAVAYGERAATAGMVATNLKRVANGYKALKRWDFSGVRKALVGVGSKPPSWRKSARNSWLELQYGWKPLLSDIKGACDALDKRDRSDFMITVKASAVSKSQIAWENTAGAWTNAFLIRGQVMYGSFVRIDACPSNAALATAASLGLTNPASVAWELTRLSFVVDWAYPLGDYFDQLDAGLGWEVKGYSVSNLIRHRLYGEGVSKNVVGQPWYDRCLWNSTWKYTKLQRTAGGTVPFATLPSVKDPISGKRVADALALLGQAFGR